jgi:hypothetical protein
MRPHPPWSDRDLPAEERHVWEANNLAQKNLSVVDLEPGDFVVLPVVVTAWVGRGSRLQVRRSDKRLLVGVVHPSMDLLERAGLKPTPLADDLVRFDRKRVVRLLDCGGLAPGAVGVRDMLTSRDIGAVLRRFPEAWQAALSDEPVVLVPENRPQLVIGLKVEVTAEICHGTTVTVDFVQRETGTGRVVGGIAVALPVQAASSPRMQGASQYL